MTIFLLKSTIDGSNRNWGLMPSQTITGTFFIETFEPSIDMGI